MISRLLFMCATLVLMASTTAHALWMPAVFSSNMVLQRGPQQAQLWGSAAPNSVVKFTLDSLAFGTFADANGNWQYELPAQDASAGHTLTVAGDSTSMTFENVAFGDVYICSGQSNMEMVIGDAFNASETFANSINYPNLRLFTVTRTVANSPANDTTGRFPNTNGWLVSSPEAVNGSSWSYFSATCYFFGEALYNNLNGAVPIGLIETCWGGTRVEAWTTADGLAVCGPVVPEMEGSNLDAKTLSLADGSKVNDPDPQAASVLWNGMVAPFVNLRLTGVTWYQGEANAGNATNYACRFPAMIQDWRTQFNNYKLYFYFVVLAAYKEGGNPTWSLIRDAQLQALDLPYVGAATAQDLGDELSGLGPIHPRNKTIVGQRLSLNAQFQVYGQDVISMGPSYTDIVWPLTKSGVQTAILRFRSDDMYAQDLHLLGTSGCSACCNMTGSPIALMLSDGTTRQAEVQTFPDLYMVTATVDLTSSPGVYVTGLQLNWVDYPECALYNSANLPHLPFSVSAM